MARPYFLCLQVSACHRRAQAEIRGGKPPEFGDRLRRIAVGRGQLAGVLLAVKPARGAQYHSKPLPVPLPSLC